MDQVRRLRIKLTPNNMKLILEVFRGYLMISKQVLGLKMFETLIIVFGGVNVETSRYITVGTVNAMSVVRFYIFDQPEG